MLCLGIAVDCPVGRASPRVCRFAGASRGPRERSAIGRAAHRRRTMLGQYFTGQSFGDGPAPVSAIRSSRTVDRFPAAYRQRHRAAVVLLPSISLLTMDLRSATLRWLSQGPALFASIIAFVAVLGLPVRRGAALSGHVPMHRSSLAFGAAQRDLLGIAILLLTPGSLHRQRILQPSSWRPHGTPRFCRSPSCCRWSSGWLRLQGQRAQLVRDRGRARALRRVECRPLQRPHLVCRPFAESRGRGASRRRLPPTPRTTRSGDSLARAGRGFGTDRVDHRRPRCRGRFAVDARLHRPDHRAAACRWGQARWSIPKTAHAWRACGVRRSQREWRSRASSVSGTSAASGAGSRCAPFRSNRPWIRT